MNAASIVRTAIVVLGCSAVGACGAAPDGASLGSEPAGATGDDDGDDLDADFGGTEGELTPADPDEHPADSDIDFTGDDVPLDFPSDDGPLGLPHDGDPNECTAVDELCDNGLDDDCDGLVDASDSDCAACTWQTLDCSQVEVVGHCNDHLGDDIDACYAAGNAGNCDEEELYAWCTRRVYDSEDGPWFEYIESWVDEQCNGEVRLEVIDGHDVYTCNDESSCIRYECATPLVLVFGSEQAVHLQADDGRSCFDLSRERDGSATRTDWPTAATPWLALDRDGDGAIGSGQELFGSASPVPDGHAANGFEPLGQLDENGDGLLDRCDASFDELVVWSDANADRVSQPDELRRLADLGVEAIELAYRLAVRCDERGNCERERSRFVYRGLDGALHEGAVVDVHLAARR